MSVVPKRFERLAEVIKEVRETTLSPAEVERLERPGQGPSRAKSEFDRGVHVLDARLSASHGIDGFAPKRRLKPVRQMPGSLQPQADRMLSEALLEGHRVINGPVLRLRPAYDLDQGYDVRRIERMADQQPVRERQTFLQV